MGILRTMSPVQRTTIKLRVQEHRIRAGLSQAALAEATGLTQAMIAHVENGRRLPSLEALVTIARVLQVSTCKLIEES